MTRKWFVISVFVAAALLCTAYFVLFATSGEYYRTYSPDKQFSVYASKYAYERYMPYMAGHAGDAAGKVYLYDELEKKVIASARIPIMWMTEGIIWEEGKAYFKDLDYPSADNPWILPERDTALEIDTSPKSEIIAATTQPTENPRLDSIRALVNLIADNNKGITAVTDFEDKTEFWSFGYQGDSLRSYQIESYEDEQLYTEYYVEYKGQVVLAEERETWIPMNHFPQYGWNCVLFIDQGEIIHMTSLGHGKTESDDWSPEEVITHFYQRKKQSEQIKEYYNPE